MEKSNLKLKVLLSKDGEELGKILRVDERSGYGDQKEFYYVILYRETRLKKLTFELPMKSYHPYNVTNESVSIGIDKDEFELLIKQYKTDRKLKAKGAKFAKVKKTDEAMARTLTGRW